MTTSSGDAGSHNLQSRNDVIVDVGQGKDNSNSPVFTPESPTSVQNKFNTMSEDNSSNSQIDSSRLPTKKSGIDQNGAAPSVATVPNNEDFLLSQIMQETENDNAQMENITKKDEPSDILESAQLQVVSDEAEQTQQVASTSGADKEREVNESRAGNVEVRNNISQIETDSTSSRIKTSSSPTTNGMIDTTISAERQQTPTAAKINLSPREPDEEDFDSEDEEFQSLVAAKKKQIRADIIAYQNYLELELVVYEKRLREDFARKKRRRAMQNGMMNRNSDFKLDSNTPSQNRNFRLPTQFLPLLEGSNISSFPRSPSSSTSPSELTLNSSQAESEQGTQNADSAALHEEETQLSTPSSRSRTPSPGLRPQKELGELKTPPRAPSPMVVLKDSATPAQASTTRSEPLTKLSLSNLAHLDVRDKTQPPLASSIRSTSSWSSGTGKHSHKNSVAEGQRKKKRVVFQLMTVEGDCLRVRPDGEEIPLNESEKEQIKNEIEAAEVLEEEERIRSNIELSEGPSLLDTDSESVVENQVLSMPSFSGNTSEITNEDLEEADDTGNNGHDKDWVFANSTAETMVDQGMGGSFSDSDDGDMFDLDEEMPHQYNDKVSVTPTSNNMEESVLSLGLPFAPAPPPPPAGEAVITSPTQFGYLRRSNSIGLPDTRLVETPLNQQATQTAGVISSSYVSTSLPLSSYSLVNPLGFMPVRTSFISPALNQQYISNRSSAPAMLGENSNPNESGYVSPPTNNQPFGSAGRDSFVSAGSSSPRFRRKSVTKYIDNEPDDTDTENKTEQILQDQPKGDPAPPTTRSDNTDSVVAMVPSRNPIDKEADILSSLSPYGTSAPITIVRRSPTGDSAKSGKIKTDNLKDSTSDTTTRRRKIGDPILVAEAKPVETPSPLGSLRQYILKSAEKNTQTKSARDVDDVLSATSEGLRKNSLPSTLKDDETKIPAEEIAKQWDEAHNTFIIKKPSERPLKPVLVDHVRTGYVLSEPFYDTEIEKEHEEEEKNDGKPLLFATIKSSANWATNPVTALPLPITNDLEDTFTRPGIKVKEESKEKKKKKIILNPSSVYSSASAEKVAAAAAAAPENFGEESIVGGIDGRSGVDASLVRHGTPSFKGMNAESLSKAGIKPESMSFSMRMAMEEET